MIESCITNKIMQKNIFYRKALDKNGIITWFISTILFHVNYS
jgi:hypothetical protein